MDRTINEYSAGSDQSNIFEFNQSVSRNIPSFQYGWYSEKICEMQIRASCICFCSGRSYLCVFFLYETHQGIARREGCAKRSGLITQTWTASWMGDSNTPRRATGQLPDAWMWVCLSKQYIHFNSRYLALGTKSSLLVQATGHMNRNIFH